MQNLVVREPWIVDAHNTGCDAMLETHFESLVERFRCPDARAVVLVGSFARGDAGPFSDVDLVRFLREGTHVNKARTHLVGAQFVVVSDMEPSEVERCFTKPVDATEYIAGLRTARTLWAPDGYFDAIQQRAHAFVWGKDMQEKADAWASTEMVGWIEEVHKGLEGLCRGDEGRLLVDETVRELPADEAPEDGAAQSRT